MIVDIGSADSGWSEYTLGQDGNREGATLIMGDTVLGDQICNSTEYANGQYLRLVISFFDDISPEKGREISKEFIELFTHGFRSDEFHADLVEHLDSSKIHYHARIAKLNLLTGTQLKLYWHKADIARKKAIVDYLCKKHGLTHAMDRRNLNIDPNKKVEQINRWREQNGQKPFVLTKKKGRGEAEEQITDYLNQMVVDGYIDSLDDVRGELIALGFEIVKADHDILKDFDYITVQNDTGKIRLKGDIYGERFYGHSRADRAKAVKNNKRIGGGGELSGRSLADLYRELEDHNTKRFEWIGNRYGGARARAIQEHEDEQQQLDKEFHQDTQNANDLSYPHRSSVGDNNRWLISPTLTPRPTEHSKIPQADEPRRNDNTDTKEIKDEDDRTRSRTIDRIRRIAERTRSRNEDLKRLTHTVATPESEDYKAIVRATEARAEARGLEEDINTSISIIANSFGNLYKGIKRSTTESVEAINRWLGTTIKGKLMEELKRFKTDINLAEFSTVFGYFKDKDKSSSNAPVMRHENGDKIIIGKDKADGHYIYFNPNNDSDKGTIIDFVKHRTKDNLGQIRRRLRVWQHNPQPQENIPVKASSKDTQMIVSEWLKLQANKSDIILSSFAGLDSKTITNVISKRGIVYTNRRELCFGLFDLSGICGIEKRYIKDGGVVKHIVEGSTKGIFTHGELKDAERIIFFESPIDWLSWKELGNGKINDFVVCTMGSIGESGLKSVEAILDYNKTAETVLAFDNDDGGQILEAKIQLIDIAREFKIIKPILNDWNDDLKKKKESGGEKQGMVLKP